MSLLSGLRAVLCATLLSGLNATCGPGILARLDFSEPVIQNFSTTAAGLASALGDPAATASYIWDCQETSGNLVDSIASEPLVPTSSPLQGQTAVGLWDGTSLTSRNSAEGVSSASVFEASDSTAMDSNGTSFAHLVVFRCSDATATSQYLLRKRVSAGYYMRINTDGKMWGLVQDTSANQQIAFVNVAGHDDGAWHVCIMGHHDGDNETHIYSDLGSGTDTTPALTAGVNNTDPLTLHDDARKSQIAYVASFEGAAAEALLDLGATAITNFWQHASDPTGLLTTQTRNCLISNEVAPGYVGHFAPNTLPIVHHDALPGTKLGLLCNSVRTNLLGYSESIAANWTFTGTTPTAGDGDSPDGFRNADKVESTTGHGEAKLLWTSVASTDYTESLWVQWVSGDKDFHLQLYDETGSALVAELDATATADWARYDITGTTNVGQISSSLIFQAHANGGTFRIWGAQAETGPNATAYIRSDSGSTTSLVAHDYRASGNIVQEAKGELSFVGVRLAESSTVSLLCTDNGADERRVYAATASGRLGYIGRADDVSIQYQIIPLTTHAVGTLLNSRMAWDDGSDGVGGYKGVIVENGVRANGGVAPWSSASGGGFVGLQVGQNRGATGQVDAILQEIISYDGLSEALP